MLKAIEVWASEKNTADWLLAATKTKHQWGQGKEVDEATFDAAVEATGNIKLHAYALPPAPKAPPVAARELPAEPMDRDATVIDDRPAKHKRG